MRKARHCALLSEKVQCEVADLAVYAKVYARVAGSAMSNGTHCIWRRRGAIEDRTRR